MTRRTGVQELVSAGGMVYRALNGQVEIVVCGRSLPLIWGLPKGTPNPGESYEQTALREVREETGLDVALEAFIDDINYWFLRPGDRVRCHKTVFFYLMSPTGGDTVLHDEEFDVVRWLPAEQALKTLSYENEVSVVKKGLSLISTKAVAGDQVIIRGNKVLLREKRIEDVANDYAWRTDEELSRLDATRPLDMSYAEYIRYTKDELTSPNPRSRRFAIDTLDGKHIGNCMYYDIDLRQGETELGIMIGDRGYWSKSYGTDAVTCLLDHIFSEPRINRVYLHTLEWNNRARRSFAKAGFREIKIVRRSGMDFILMEVLRPEWELSRSGQPST